MRAWFAVAAAAWVACSPAAPPPPASPLVVPPVASASAAAPAPPIAQPEIADYAKPLRDARASDADLAGALQEITRRAQAGETIDPAAVDALWQRFASFRPSRAKSISLVKGLHDAVLAVKAPAYGPKAAALLEVPVRNPQDPHEMMDQIQYLQNTAAQLIGLLDYRPGAAVLLRTMLAPGKRDLLFPIRNSLARMPTTSEPLLIAALGSASKADVPIVADALNRISRPAGRDAVLAALDKADDDETRALLAINLPLFPADPALVTAYRRAYAKVSPKTELPVLGGLNARAALLTVADVFADPSLVPWLLKEVSSAKGDAGDQLQNAVFPAAIKLMTTTTSPSVKAAIAAKQRGASREKDMHSDAELVLGQCKQDPVCYLKYLDTPVAPGAHLAGFPQEKAAAMVAIYGNTQSRDGLVKKLATVTDANVRAAMGMAILHLSPQGDRASADAIDALVAAERQAGNMAAIDELHVLAQRLRARAL